ncbi:uncharacterized protein LOC105700962 [Orussus abietinus]|uniref:uncharacterized protein LOC105700962 n=1 Tax=Orussus abietinus TaxID=222816 RepID=UPI0006264F7E|nr:uncharacterized protein LOC105700962 [Orussus abietinus]
MMMWKAKWAHLQECFCKRPGLVLILLPCLLILTLYFISGSDPEYIGLQYFSFRSYNASEELVDGYLVWNPKCHMHEKNPMDPSIVKFVKRVQYEACSKTPPLTFLERSQNGSIYLLEDPEVGKLYKNLTCCWSPVIRPETSPPGRNVDSTISVEACQDFQRKLQVPQNQDLLVVSCRTSNGGDPKPSIKKKPGSTEVYKNVHPILNPEHVRDRLNQSERSSEPRKLSILMLGIDSVSRLNFRRTMPRTERHMSRTGWIPIQGYNKMGDNTFPNLMAILTGQDSQQAYGNCKPKELYGLDNCSLIWYNFRDAGYVTAYGEDETSLSTFNYLKVGFVQPPTDYYLRPYMIASEKLLSSKKRFNAKYCTGPEVSAERILDYALEFAKTFLGVPYFGFFWTNSISHDAMNGPSSMDERILRKLEVLEREGVLNDSMVVFLSDHGMRWGGIRDTFVGWYEERLPFIYVRLPDWFREQDPRAQEALRINSNRLTSPYDLYETLRDVLIRSGGIANSSSGCSTCQTLLKPVPKERGCEDAGVAAHWCTCTAFKAESTGDKIALEGAQKFLEHMENIVKGYKNSKGKRLCAPLKLKKLIRVDKVINLSNSISDTEEYFYLLQVTPGNGKFEVTIRYHGDSNFTVTDDEVSRVNSYASDAKCLTSGMKQYCHCLK